jgi:DNA-binding phage protein
MLRYSSIEGVVMASQTFYQDLLEDLKDPEFLREYIKSSIRISTVDAIINGLEARREELGKSKADIANALELHGAAVRRLFTSKECNPTIGAISEIAAVLGMRIVLEPMRSTQSKIVASALETGGVKSPEKLVKALTN